MSLLMVVYAPEMEKPPQVYFDKTQSLPFAVLEHFVTIVAARLASTG